MDELKSLFRQLRGKFWGEDGQAEAQIDADLEEGLEDDFGNLIATVSKPTSGRDGEAEHREAEQGKGTPSEEARAEEVEEISVKSLCPGKFCAGWMTDVGRVRGHNEDAIFIFTGEQEADNAMPPFGAFILADGMGGHQGGELASALAVRESATYLMSEVYLPLLSGAEREGDQLSLTEILRGAIVKANRVVTQSLPGSGSTLTCGVVVGDRLFIGHVGDSRAYLQRDDEAPQLLTHDHSLVNRLLEMGQLTEEEAAVHPQRNVLYRAIGQGGTLDVDVQSYPLQERSRLLLCSDGLWGLLEEPNLWALIKNAPTPQAACQALVESANEAGGTDNISVILVEILGA
ncbi:MAG: SpoIIE family protein phosphatase [Chloroflexi bacterium]|jgi:serine/threonine protein phosphatase PrpC|nr:SpoIIE family protein phosphatase [Chloroflexota bacterium]